MKKPQTQIINTANRDIKTNCQSKPKNDKAMAIMINTQKIILADKVLFNLDNFNINLFIGLIAIYLFY